MSTLKERQALIGQMAQAMGKSVYNDAEGKQKDVTPRLELQSKSPKLVTLEEAIRRSGLRDGMTISFHHHFRGGDKVVNMVVDKLAEMGFKNLHLAASSLQDVHAPLIEHVKNGVITEISTSGLRGELANEISRGLMEKPVVFRSHGGRGEAIANGDLHIDVAFLGASSSDPLGNACGYSRSENAKSICGSLGYALPDAHYADKVVILTDDLVAYPNTPNSISEHDVDFVVEVDSVGDSSKIASGAIRDTKNPRDILLAKQAAKVIINSGYFKDGFSIQTGSGGASLAAVKYIRQSMIDQNIKASFALGGITAHMVKMHEEGLIERLIDVQSFDKVAAESLKNDPTHKEVAAYEYASMHEEGSATHCLDIVILSALEVDVNFNVNVLGVATVSSVALSAVTLTQQKTRLSASSSARCSADASRASLTRLRRSLLRVAPLTLSLQNTASPSIRLVLTSQSACARLVSTSLLSRNSATVPSQSSATPHLCHSAIRWSA